MPSAQVINFGEDPYANAMGGFARNFVNVLNEKAGQRRNDEMFRRISENYGPNAQAEDIFRDLVKAEGFDPEYKRNKLAEIKELATLSSKADKNGYELAKLEQRRSELINRREANRIKDARLKHDQDSLLQQQKNNANKLSNEISNFVNKNIKEDPELNTPEHRADLAALVRQLHTDPEEPMALEDAFLHAYNFKKAEKHHKENAKITPRTNRSLSFFYSDEDRQRDEEDKLKAERELKILHDTGRYSQTELTDIAKRSNWKADDIHNMLTNIYRQSGSKPRGPKPKGNTPEQAAQIPFQEQHVAQDAADDALLFGE